jgi:hypothetical protein
VLFPAPSHAPSNHISIRSCGSSATRDESVGIERNISGQCDYEVMMFESIQIKTILNREIETVLISLKRSTLVARNAHKSGVSLLAMNPSITKRRLHHRKQLIDGLLHDQPHAIVNSSI